MKKMKIISAVLSLMIIFTACGKSNDTRDNMYSKIHELYYDIQSYSANCKVTAYTKGGENTYECQVNYDSKNKSYTVTSDDMKIHLKSDKTIITKGQNTIESPTAGGDMYIFVNTFFKSYYESEDTAVVANAKDKSDTFMLECSAVNPTDYVSSMKLWIDTKTVLPQKMQVLGNDENVTCEVNFTKFEFIK